MPNPRLRHLERIGELTSEPVKPKKLEWKVKVEVVREPERRLKSRFCAFTTHFGLTNLRISFIEWLL